MMYLRLILVLGLTLALAKAQPDQPQPKRSVSQKEKDLVIELTERRAHLERNPQGEVEAVTVRSVAGTKELLERLSVFPALEELWLVTYDGTDAIIPALEQIPSLKFVALLHLKVSPAGIERLDRILKKRSRNANDQHFTLSTGLVSQRLPGILELLHSQQPTPGDSALRKLDIERCQVVSELVWYSSLTRAWRTLRSPCLKVEDSSLALKAGLALTSTPEEKIRWHEAHLEVARQWETWATAGHNSDFASVSTLDLNLYKLLRVQAELALAEARDAAAKK